jgi:hypothetical protein
VKAYHKIQCVKEVVLEVVATVVAAAENSKMILPVETQNIASLHNA